MPDLRPWVTQVLNPEMGHCSPHGKGAARAGPHPCVGVEALQEGPAPVLVLAVPSQAVQVE